MDMQDVDFEMKYEPDRADADPLNNDPEKILKAATETKHAVVLDRIEEETRQDTAQLSGKGTGKQERRMLIWLLSIQ